MNFSENIPTDFVRFLLVALFALLIGLEQRRHHEINKTKFLFGTDRTFAFIVGVTDIDPFLLNLFQGKQTFAEPIVVAATIQATISNNFLKALYGVTLGTPSMRRYLWLGFGAVIVASFVVLWIF